MGERLARDRARPFRLAESEKRVSGIYRWPIIEKALGRQVTGLIRDSGISWDLGRKRGPGIGM